jgi:cytosine/adenosine deaminase-related metal-dependent hydrolase
MRLLIKGRDSAIAVEDGHICDLNGPFQHVFHIPDGDILPGLINAHDHLHRNHYGRLGQPPYANAYEWARDIRQRYPATIAAGRAVPRRQALLAGAWKNLLSGVTHVLHHDAWESDFDQDFPLTVVRVASADSLGQTPQAITPEPDRPFALHVAEGVDERAATEIKTLQARAILGPNLLAVHVVGAAGTGITLLRQSGCAIVHCPSSNHFLFGRSAPQELLADGIDILLGSDSLLTGAGGLLEDINLALPALGPARVAAAVGSLAARRLGIPAPSLNAGVPANITVLRQPLGKASRQDVALVMARGKLQVLDPALGPPLRAGQIFRWRGVARWLATDVKMCIAP